MEKTFIFDMDGLLLDSERLIINCVLDAAPADCDRERLRGAMLETLGVTDAEVQRIIHARMGADFLFEECEKRAETLYFAHLAAEGVPVKPGARELLAHLDERGYAVGLASSSPLALVRKELDMAGLIGYFKTIATGDMVARSKPAPDVFLLACDRLGVRPECAYAVEDSPKGVQAAAAAGMKPLMVPDLAPASDALRPLCHGVFSTLHDVLDWVKACESSESD